MSGKKTALIIVGVIILLFGIAGAVFMLQQQQDQRSSADEGDDIPQFPDDEFPPADAQQTSEESEAVECTPPGKVEGVLITYPYCQGGGADCTTVKAECTWTEVSDAEKYKIKITEIDSNTVKKEEELAKGTKNYVFDVVANNTYRCEVTAVNACGANGETGDHQFTCKVIGQLITTPTVPPPTGTPAPSTPPPTEGPTSPPPPTQAPLPETGFADSSLFIGIGGVALVVLGGLLFAL